MALIARNQVQLSPWALRRKLETGQWQRMLPSVYWDQPAAPSLTVWPDAALLWAGETAVLSGQTAAKLHGLDAERPWRDLPVSLTVPPSRTLRAPRTRVQRAHLEHWELTQVHGRRCTTVARTLLDVAPTISRLSLAMAFESAWRRDPLLPEIIRHNFLGSGERGAGPLRQVLEDSDLRPQPLLSALEVRAWCFLKEEGFPLPVVGHVLFDDEGLLVLDFAYPDRGLAIETDGRRWHEGTDLFVADARRRSRIAALGFKHVTLTDHEVTRRRPELRTRLRALFERNPKSRAAPQFEEFPQEVFTEPEPR